jgi:hypothetical protein
MQMHQRALVRIENARCTPKYAMNVDGFCKSGDRGYSGAGPDATFGGKDWRVYLFSGPNNFYVYYDQCAEQVIVMRNWEGAEEMESGYCINLLGRDWMGDEDDDDEDDDGDDEDDVE